MSKSLIQVANTAEQAVTVGSTLPLGTTIRRFGCNLRLSGNTAIEVSGEGYYTISGTVTLTPDAIGNVAIAVQENGVTIPGTAVTGSVSTVGNSVTLPVEATIRKGCNCSGADQLTLVLTEGASAQNTLSLRVEKA